MVDEGRKGKQGGAHLSHGGRSVGLTLVVLRVASIFSRNSRAQQ